MRMRRTKLMVDHENNMIRDYIKIGATLYQIRESLKLSERNFRKRITKIRAQDLDKILDEQSAEARSATLENSKQIIERLLLQANQILNSSTETTSNRLNAMDKVRQYAIDLLKLFIEGPMILQVVPRDGLHRGDKGTAALLRDAPLLSGSGDSIPTNPEEQF